MSASRKSLLSTLVAVLALGTASAQAAVQITEFAPWASGNSPVGADWFELTNTGSAAVDLTGWSMDDSSATPGVAPLLGVSSIAAGQSVVFIEGDGSANAAFIDTWFAGNAPVGFTLGHYAGSGVGLSTSGDGIYIFDASNALQAGVTFGASSSAPYATFDNAAGLNGVVSQWSVVGVNGAFVAAHDLNEIGSPGTIAAVPEPASAALVLVGLGVVAACARRRQP